MRLRYYVFGSDDPDDARDASLAPRYGTGENAVDLKSTAKWAAEDFHANRGGWEVSWPIVIVLLRDDGSEAGRFDVERELVPEFTARTVRASRAEGEGT